MNDIKFDLNDIVLIPTIISDVISRTEINIYDENGKLPLFVAPMDTVIDDKNYELLNNLGFNICIPRQNPLNKRNIYPDDCFISFGLDELDNIISNNEKLPKKVLIDVANAHSIRVFNLSKTIKEKYDVVLMVGNIANPKTIIEYDKIGVDYIRVGIGGGNVCTTSANSSIHYPMGSLIKECNDFKNEYNLNIRIVADGGFNNFDDINKAISLGAYVMLGSIINKSIESCGDNFINNEQGYIKVTKTEAINIFKNGQDIYKKYRGMSTKEVQQKWGKEILKTSEGISKYNKVEYSIISWIDNFKSYLKTALSYQGYYDIKDFKGSSNFINITINSYNRFHK